MYDGLQAEEADYNMKEVSKNQHNWHLYRRWNGMGWLEIRTCEEIFMQSKGKKSMKEYGQLVDGRFIRLMNE